MVWSQRKTIRHKFFSFASIKTQSKPRFHTSHMFLMLRRIERHEYIFYTYKKSYLPSIARIPQIHRPIHRFDSVSNWISESNTILPVITKLWCHACICVRIENYITLDHSEWQSRLSHADASLLDLTHTLNGKRFYFWIINELNVHLLCVIHSAKQHKSERISQLMYIYMY